LRTRAALSAATGPARLWAALLLVAVGCVACGPAHGQAASPAAQCRHLGTDDRLRPLPDSLVPTAARLFDLGAMPAAQIRQSTYWRCLSGRLLLCNVGANLPCGKANTSRQPVGAGAWCAAHPQSDFIPMYITGHDTIYRWRCAGGKPATTGLPEAIDRRGFIARYWKAVDPG
jgi:hypothetical protein